MRGNYRPSPADILKAIGLLGIDAELSREMRPNGVIEEDYPFLVGNLRAAAEITSNNVLSFDDHDEEVASYQTAFLTPSDGEEETFDHAKAWEEFLLALMEHARVLDAAHDIQPEIDVANYDRPLKGIASAAATIAFYAADMRVGLALKTRGEDSDPFAEGIERLCAHAKALTAEVGLLKMDEASGAPEIPYTRNVPVDLGDDYDEVMAEYLDQMVAGGHIERWEHQPENGGNGNGSIWFVGGGKLANLLINYEDALNYGMGYMTAVEDQANKNKEH